LFDTGSAKKSLGENTKHIFKQREYKELKKNTKSPSEIAPLQFFQPHRVIEKYNVFQ